MRKPNRIFEDVKRGFLRGRFVELKQIGERSPTYNLCTLKEYDYIGAKKRTDEEKDQLELRLYSKVLLKKERELKHKLEKKKESQLTEAERHTVKESIKKYLDEILTSRSKSSQLLFAQQLSFWQYEMGHVKLSNLKAINIQATRDKLKNDSRTNSTVNRYMQSFSAVIGSAVKDFHWLEHNPCSQIRKLPEPKGRARYLKDDELKSLLTACTGDLYLAVLLALSTGARQQEIWGLKWQDIDFKRGLLIFILTKSGEPRSVPMTQDCQAHLQQRFAEKASDKFVFPSPVKDNKPNDFNRTWRTTLKNTGITDFKWHDLRHSAASYLVMAGVPIREVSEILGHSSITMSVRYTHLSSEALRPAINKLSAKLT